MLRRLLRWSLRTALSLVLLAVVAAIIDFFLHRVEAGSVLVVDVDGQVVERGQAHILGIIGGRETPLNVVRRAIDQASTDPRVAGLALEIFDPEMELGQAQELSALVHKFSQHGKWTTAYLESAGEFAPGNLPYLVASSAPEVSMMPQGELNLVGVGMREVFARGTLDWLGIKPNFEAIGRYKSAANIFVNKDFTPAQREEDESLMSDLFDQIVSQVATQRRLPPATVRTLVNRAPLTAAEAVKARLLDRLEYLDQFTRRLRHYGGRSHRLVTYDRYARPYLLPSFRTRPEIAVIYGVGAIQRGKSGLDPLLSPEGNAMGSDDMVEAFTKAREDSAVRAVVFRINSPGGSVIGSELIRRQVELTEEKKPVVVSMSAFAASGGYWVSMPVRKIFADPGSITGSIGVLGGKFNLAGAASKLGINSGAINRGDNVSMFDSFSDFTPAQQQLFNSQLVATYDYFLKLVSQSRHLTVEEVSQLAQGRVYSGAAAFKLKLVDAQGGLDETLSAAKQLAKIKPEEEVEIVELPAVPGLLERLLSGRVGAQGLLGPPSSALAPLIHLWRAALEGRSGLGLAYCPLIPIM